MWLEGRGAEFYFRLIFYIHFALGKKLISPPQPTESKLRKACIRKTKFCSCVVCFFLTVSAVVQKLH